MTTPPPGLQEAVERLEPCPWCCRTDCLLCSETATDESYARHQILARIVCTNPAHNGSVAGPAVVTSQPFVDPLKPAPEAIAAWNTRPAAHLPLPVDGDRQFRIVEDGLNANNLRIYKGTDPWCKVYGFSPEEARAKADVILAALNTRPTTPADGLVEALKSVLSKIGVAESCLEAMGRLRNEAGYLTDAGLWLDRAASECRQALSPKEPTP